MTEDKCMFCKKGEIDYNCKINFNWKEKEDRGTYYTCIFCWDDLSSIFGNKTAFPFSGNTLEVSVK